jgi:hypothetical protein
MPPASPALEFQHRHPLARGRQLQRRQSAGWRCTPPSATPAMQTACAGRSVPTCTCNASRACSRAGWAVRTRSAATAALAPAACASARTAPAAPERPWRRLLLPAELPAAARLSCLPQQARTCRRRRPIAAAAAATPAPGPCLRSRLLLEPPGQLDSGRPPCGGAPPPCSSLAAWLGRVCVGLPAALTTGRRRRTLQPPPLPPSPLHWALPADGSGAAGVGRAPGAVRGLASLLGLAALCGSARGWPARPLPAPGAHLAAARPAHTRADSDRARHSACSRSGSKQRKPARDLIYVAPGPGPHLPLPPLARAAVAASGTASLSAAARR